jgi:hypothetical protein
MKYTSCLLVFALIMGCGGADQEAPTPEKEAEMKAAMDAEMQKMTGQMQKPPGTPNAKTP